MRQEERDVYVIPPNFIEGGTLMGGMFKTRNTIEAGVLGVLTALPVLQLNLSLTVRIIILCLTTLPLVLVALIGVGGQSLSQFIFQFILWLRNRRVLDQSGAGSQKGLLPSWAQKEHTAGPEVEELPKSRRRFQVDVKRREVSQHKTFLEREEVVKPLNPLADYVPIEKITHGVIKTRDRRYVKVVEVVPVNFLLRSAQEQRSIIYSFISYLKIAPVKVQFKVLTKRADIDRHVDGVREELARETDPHCRMLQEDYLRLIRDLGSREAITRRFFLIFEHEPMPGTKRGQEEEEAIASLQTAARTAANYLRQCGNTVLLPEEQDETAAEILYHILCRRESNEHPFEEKERQVVAEYLAAGRDVDAIPVNEFYAPSEIDFTHGRYICIDGVYYAYLLVPSDGFKVQVPAGWLSLLVNAGDTQTIRFYDDPLCTLTILKRDAVTKKPLKGAEFLVRDSSGAVLGPNNGEYITDRNGRIVLTDLTPGTTITAKETKTAAGYVLDTTPQSILIKSGVAQTLTFFNKAEGGLELIKVSASDKSQRIPNVTFEIREMDGGLVDTITTDSNGRVHLNLDAGDYYAVETEAGEGFKIDTTPHYFTISDGKTTTLTVTNEAFSGIIIHLRHEVA